MGMLYMKQKDTSSNPSNAWLEAQKNKHPYSVAIQSLGSNVR